MNVLVSSYHNPHFMSISEYIERAFAQLGHTVIPFDDRRFLIPGRIRGRLPTLQKWDCGRINRRLLAEVRLHRPGLCLILGGYRIYRETVEHIRESGIPVVLWTVDPPANFDHLAGAASAYTRVFCGGTEAIGLLKQAGVTGAEWLPFACDPGIHRPHDLSPEENSRYQADIGFVGSLDPRVYPFRLAILEALTDFDLAVWGPGSKLIPSSSAVSRAVRGDASKPEIWTRILSAVGIALCMHYRDPLGKIPCNQASPRVYETLACGRMLLVDDQPDVHLLFKEGKHLAVFRDLNDLRNKIRFYLDHPDERERIAADGQKEVLARHSYVHRAERILRALECA